MHSIIANFYIAYNEKNFIIQFDIYIKYSNNIFVLINHKKNLSQVHSKKL